MHGVKTNFNLLAFSLISLLAFSGCGETGTDTTVKGERTVQASTYINKGNFVEVARFAYKRATDASFTQSVKEVVLPGSQTSQLAQASMYDISTILSADVVQKVVMQNHENKLEVKIVDNDYVNIVLQAKSFTVDHKMTLAAFTAMQ